MNRRSNKLNWLRSVGKKAGAFVGVFVLLMQYLVLFAPASSAHATVNLLPLHVSGDNSRYFADSNNKPVFLSGDHTWQNFVDSGNGNPPPEFDYDAYLSYINTRGANWFRLWTWEQTRWSNETTDGDYWFGPSAYNRVTGHGSANDGEDKFDLTSLNQDYFDRMRDRVIAGGEAGDYVSVMLFNGWSTECKGGGGSCGIYNQPFEGHPFNADNNINSIDGDPNSDGNGFEVHEYDSGDAGSVDIMDIEEAYVKKVIDTVGDLPNVLYEVCNECTGSSLDTAWHAHMIDLVHDYEYDQFAVNHPVGMTLQWPNSNLTNLTNSDAEWISFGGNINNPPVNDGTKVILQDTDHVCGTCANNEWAWLAATRGQNISLMDTYDGAGYGNGAYAQGDKRSSDDWEDARYGMGKTREWMGMMDLKAALPSTTNASTTFSLVNDGTAHDDQYLVFGPDGSSSFTVNLSNTAGNVVPMWYNVGTRVTTTASPVAGGSSSQTFTKPSSSTDGYALLLLEADTTAPTVSVTAPSASATVSGSSVTLSATASDNRGVVGVQFKVDGSNVGSEDTTAPYSISWDSTGVGNGSRTITAVARDAATNTTTSSGVSVTVDNGDHVNPTASLTAPANSATVSGSSTTVSATASDDVALAGVQFKLDGSNIGSEDTSYPYSISWDTTTATEGAHTITAVARDTSNNTGTSSGRTVTVDNYADMVAAYGFNNSGTPRADNSGNGYNLDCGSTCATYTSSNGHGSTGAYDFSGSGDWLEIPSESPFDFTTNMSVEYWFKTPASGYDWGGTWAVMVAKGDSAWSTGRYGGYDSTNFTTYNGTFWHDARSDNYNTTDDLNDGAWHHLAVTYDGTYKKMYIDGSLASTYSYSQTIHNNSYKVSFGKDLEWGGGQYNGLLDDVRIYSRAITSTEVTNDMNTAVN